MRPEPDQVRLKADATHVGRSVSARSIQRANGSLAFSEAHRTFTSPSPRYFVHLKAPGWNVIGATSPWLPGVAIGHNERVAWGMTPIEVDTQDIHVEEGRMGGTGGRVVSDAIVVKGRRSAVRVRHGDQRRTES